MNAPKPPCKCVLIKGKGKGGEFDVGDQTEKDCFLHMGRQSDVCPCIPVYGPLRQCAHVHAYVYNLQAALSIKRAHTELSSALRALHQGERHR